MTLSKHGEDLIKQFEGLKLDAYRDSAGVWTIGYGSTRYHDDRKVKAGDKLVNENQADALFKNTLGQYVTAVNDYVTVILSQNQFDALVSFTFNEGAAALRSSCIMRYIGQGYYDAAAKAFLNWERVGNNAHMLHNRRMREKALFETPDPPDLPPSIAV